MSAALADVFGQSAEELVAADPGDHIRVTHQSLQSFRRLDQDMITRRVAVGVVHRLEFVEVDHDERGRQ